MRNTGKRARFLWRGLQSVHGGARQPYVIVKHAAGPGGVVSFPSNAIAQRQKPSYNKLLGQRRRMILEPEHWHYAYEQILNDCRTTGEDGAPGTVFMLCNTDVDAMASARILSYMLRSDGIHYQLLPCSSYSALHKHIVLTPLQDVRAVVLLNFGASKNLTKFFDMNDKLSDTVKIYVMDCRRPVHLANIHAGDNVVVFLDGTHPDFPSDGDNLSGNESSSSSSEDDSSDDDDTDNEDGGEAEFEDPDDGEEEAGFNDIGPGEVTSHQNSRRLDDGADELTDYDGDNERDQDDDGHVRPRDDTSVDDDASQQESKRRRTESSVIHSENEVDASTDVEHSDDRSIQSSESKKPAGDDERRELSPRELHRQRQDRLTNYYSSGNFFGSPAVYVAYEMANQMRFGENNGDLLWLAIVGVTDAFLYNRLDFTGYYALATEMRRYCLRQFPDDMYQRTITSVYAEDLTGGPSGGSRTKITFSENGRILSERDYKFFLLRHSSLFEGMVHSDYVSTKLQVWNKSGMRKLQELLAKMGYPLDECRQPFAFMKPSLKRRLQEKITEHATVRSLNFVSNRFPCTKIRVVYSSCPLRPQLNRTTAWRILNSPASFALQGISRCSLQATHATQLLRFWNATCRQLLKERTLQKRTKKRLLHRSIWHMTH